MEINVVTENLIYNSSVNFTELAESWLHTFLMLNIFTQGVVLFYITLYSNFYLNSNSLPSLYLIFLVHRFKWQTIATKIVG